MIDRAAFLQRLDDLEPRVRFSAASHRYWLDGKPIVGVTTNLKAWDKPALTRWMVRVQQEADIAVAYDLMAEEHFNSCLNMPTREIFAADFVQRAGAEMEHQKQAREAADTGKQMHALLEHSFKERLGIPTEAPAASDEAQSLFSSVLEFLQSGELEPLTMERRVFNVEDWYAGTADLFALYRADPVIVDYKSRKNEGGHLWPEQRCQSAAYRSAAKSMGLGEWGGLILTVPKDGGRVTPVPVDSAIDDDMAAFRACQTLYGYGKKSKREAAAA